MSPPRRFDALAFKAELRTTWDTVSAGWATWQDQFERGAAEMTAHLLELGGVRPGQRVLDLGTGLGEPALSAARAVGPTGRVVGVDLSPEMIAQARRRAGGAANVELREGDLDSLDLPDDSFDVALSRWALMFAVDRVAALRALARVIAPGGVLAAAVWGPPATAPMISLGFRAIVEQLGLEPPPPGLPGPFSMSDPVRVAEELIAAGFVDITVDEYVVPFRLDSVHDFAEFVKAQLPPAMKERVRALRGSADDPATWEAVAEAARGYQQDGDGLLLPSVALCLRAVVAPSWRRGPGQP